MNSHHMFGSHMGDYHAQTETDSNVTAEALAQTNTLDSALY